MDPLAYPLAEEHYTHAVLSDYGGIKILWADCELFVDRRICWKLFPFIICIWSLGSTFKNDSQVFWTDSQF